MGDKKYNKPILGVVHIDSSISLMTTTTFPDDEEDPFKSSASVFNNKERILSPTVPSETGSPFGGDMPNYE